MEREISQLDERKARASKLRRSEEWKGKSFSVGRYCKATSAFSLTGVIARIAEMLTELGGPKWITYIVGGSFGRLAGQIIWESVRRSSSQKGYKVLSQQSLAKITTSKPRSVSGLS